jgi:L-aminopeptidase/D-esterase-like protein
MIKRKTYKDVATADMRRVSRSVIDGTGKTTNIFSHQSWSLGDIMLFLKTVSLPQPEGAAVQHAEHQSAVGDLSETKQQRTTPHGERTPSCRGEAAKATPGHGQ